MTVNRVMADRLFLYRWVLEEGKGVKMASRTSL